MIFADNAFLASLEGCDGFERSSFEAAHQAPSPVSIRLNPYKKNAGVLEAFASLEPMAIPWSSEGYYLKSRPSFAMDPLWHAGAYYVQEASSMFIEFLLQSTLKSQSELNALDLCAAPGGKSTLLASMPQFNLVLANEIIHSRIPSLMENAIKWGRPHLLVSNNDPAHFENLPGFFDVVLVDAPCSGSGLFRKDPEAYQEWKPDLPAFCSARQKRILHSATKALKGNGYLIYSTCSYSACENEENLDYLMDMGLFESINIEIPTEWGVVTSQSSKHNAFGYRFYPNRVQGEGFYCALLKKKEGIDHEFSSHLQSIKHQPVPEACVSWLESSEELFSFQKENEIFVQLADLSDAIRSIEPFLKLKKKFLRVGNFIRGEMIPDHELAVSTLINPNCSSLELTREQAIRYLKREELQGFEKHNGWHWVTYNKVGLGWAKGASGRFKNHYPMSWRIQKQS